MNFGLSVAAVAFAGAKERQQAGVVRAATRHLVRAKPGDVVARHRIRKRLSTARFTRAHSDAGLAGNTTGGMLARLERAVPAGTHVVILQPGTNDERMGLGAERAGNIEKIRGSLSARDTKLIIIENAMLDVLPRRELCEDGVHSTPAGYGCRTRQVSPRENCGVLHD